MDNKVNTSAYWEERYQSGRDSGSGSYGRLAEFKAEVINSFVNAHNISSVIEFGCGDGNQLSLMNYPAYVGLDVSPTVVSLCQNMFSANNAKSFCVYDENFSLYNKYDLALSLDVIYHLVENDVFEKYMQDLFEATDRFVCIYSSDEDSAVMSGYVKHRKVTAYIAANFPAWKLARHIPGRYPFNIDDANNTSFCDFFFYAKRNLDITWGEEFVPPQPGYDEAVSLLNENKKNLLITQFRALEARAKMHEANAKFHQVAAENQELIERVKSLSKGVLICPKK